MRNASEANGARQTMATTASASAGENLLEKLGALPLTISAAWAAG
jgi:hypothetical protein